MRQLERIIYRPIMKAAHAIIAWTPASAVGLETCGLVRVGLWVPRTAPHWALKFTNITGATTGARRSLTEENALKALKRDYEELRADGIGPDVINAAFAAIDGWIDRTQATIG
jgi:hypothetical protein